MPIYLAHEEEAPSHQTTTTASGALFVEPHYQQASLSELSKSAPCVFQNGFSTSLNLFLENSPRLVASYAGLGTLFTISLILIISTLVYTTWKRRKLVQIFSFVGLFLSLACMIGLVVLQGERVHFGHVDSNHVHGDISLVVRNQKIDLSDPTYISSGDQELSNMAHIHDPMGSVMHVHTTGVTWGYALQTLGISVKDECLVLAKEDRSVCGQKGDKAQLYLNNRPAPKALQTPVNDLDKFFLYIGPDLSNTPLDKEPFTFESDNACVFSGKCLSRGRLDDGKGCSSGS